MKKIFCVVVAIFILILGMTYIKKYISHSKNDFNIGFNEKRELVESYNDQNDDVEITWNFNNIVYTKNVEFNIRIKCFNEDSNYFAIIMVNDEKIEWKIENSENVKEVNKLNEGKNNIKIIIYKDDEKIYFTNAIVYYIEPYISQFNDESERKGIVVHYRNSNSNFEKFDDSIYQLNSLGVQYIRTDFLQSTIINKETLEYDFSRYDAWINKLNKVNPNLKIIAIADGVYQHGGNTILDNDSEIDAYIEYIENLQRKYPQITFFQILNEPNSYSDWKINYNKITDIKWYSRIFEKINEKINLKDKILTSGIETPDKASTKKITAMEFYNEFAKTNGLNYINNISFHPYAFNDLYRLKLIINEHRNFSNTNGGFNYLNVTEYGSSILYLDEEQQAFDLVRQSVFLDSRNINLKILYNLWTTSNDSKSLEQFGLLRHDYTPRPSYYSMKKYYENTNGSEYIGYIQNYISGITFHVYDKDGVPLVVCWSNDNSKTIEIPYSGFTAYDLYGNEIENTDGKLSITSSPVYLKNADRSYFYRAISNTAVSAYDEFLTNYADYLDSSDEMIAVKNKVNQMKKYAEGLANGGEISEAEALNKMEEHFAIGDMILKAYKDGTLSCEYVKLSSMLDQLNTVAYAFEDLVTITAKDVSNAKLEEANNLMNSFENVVSENSEIEMVYPNKIKSFAKDYYDTSSYINGLEEENPIKNGLIISKGLHAYYLAGWANSFAECYVQDYDVKIKYSTTELTNQDVVVTLETDSPIEMDGSNQYTFTENGSFTFKYILNGEEKEITAVVDWIDKEAPVISGIDEREDEMDQVTLNVSDSNLDSITLKKDGQDISFNNGDVLVEVGEYIVTATDLAGNKVEKSFKIVDYIESNKTYYVSVNGIGDGLSEDTPMNVKDVNKTRFYSGDKILFKSGEKYSVDLDCIRKGSPDNRVVISNYGDGELPIINGSISLVSNLEISNLKFTNNTESCLVTNYDFCENVKISNCIFDNVADTAVCLNRQVSNIEITNCIFKNCKSAAIVMKNDNAGFEADNVSIKNNVFINLNKSIEIGSEISDNSFSKIEISRNYFVCQTGSDYILNINKIVSDKFEVYVYSNLFYGFDNVYKVGADDENIKKFLVCDYNAFYRYSTSNIFNDIKNVDNLSEKYENEKNSKVVFITKEKYEVDNCLENVSALNSVDEIVEYLSKDIKEHEEQRQLRSYEKADELIINKILTADELKKTDMKVMTDATVADEKLPLAGWQKISIVIIAIIAVTGLFSAGKYAKFKKDTRKQIRRK